MNNDMEAILKGTKEEYERYLELVKECNEIGYIPVCISGNVPIWKKKNLTVKEASILFNIGRNKLYELISDQNCNFVLYVGEKVLIKREKFEQFLDSDSTYSI